MRSDPRVIIETSPDVYRPAEDSHLLLAAVEVSPEERFLEVGTGTGPVAIHAARIARLAVATDANPAAAGLSRRNAALNRVPLAVVQCDLMAGVRGPFDVIAFNPPYLEGQPTDEIDRAWSAGDEGSDAAVRFLEHLPRILSSRGRACLLLERRNERARALAHSRFRVRMAVAKDLLGEGLEIPELHQR